MSHSGNNVIVNMTFDFALEIIDFTEQIKEQKKFRLADQLFRSGTSIGANVSEAQNAESRADFIHTLKIAAKEADETNYWLKLCKASNHYPTNDKLLEDVVSINKVLSKIISSSKKSIN